MVNRSVWIFYICRRAPRFGPSSCFFRKRRETKVIGRSPTAAAD